MPQGVAIAVNGRPDEELGAAAQVEVLERVGQATSYRLVFDVPGPENGDFTLLTDGRMDPNTELMVLVQTEGATECLVKGPVLGHRVRLTHGNAGSTLEVRGSDTSVAMDREPRSTVWANMRDSDAALAILAGYGYVPDVESTSALHDLTKHALAQTESDLRFIRRMARRNGFLFWVTSTPLGIETAHFKSPPLDGEGQVDLTINLERHSVESLEFEWDIERPTSVIASQLDLNSKREMDGGVPAPDYRALGTEGVADIVGETSATRLVAPVDSVGDLQARSQGIVQEAGWFLRATATTSLETLGAVLRTHSLVRVRGAGSRYSGTYFVGSVRHLIDSRTHRMELELMRNGWGA